MKMLVQLFIEAILEISSVLVVLGAIGVWSFLL
jgi:hypothetical protein